MRFVIRGLELAVDAALVAGEVSWFEDETLLPSVCAGLEITELGAEPVS
jgi:hypothetical protein